MDAQASMDKIKLVVSDFHLGRGRYLEDRTPNPLEDFFCDEMFVEFLEHHSSGAYAHSDVELILNGDFFNMLEVEEDEVFPEVLTQRVAVEKTRKILDGHPDLFRSMRGFMAEDAHGMTFVIGNHDAGLLWPDVQALVRRALSERVRFRDVAYVFDGFHVEHGQQFEDYHRIDPEAIFVTEGVREPILNLPWSAYFVADFLNRMKKERPFLDKIHPFRNYFAWAMLFDFRFALRMMARMVGFYFRNRFHRSAYRRAKFVLTPRLLRCFSNSSSLDGHARKILLATDCHTVILGHTHRGLHRRMGPDKEYLNTGTWNEVTTLEIGRLGTSSQRTYVLIEYPASGRPHARLKVWHGRHRIEEDAVG